MPIRARRPRRRRPRGRRGSVSRCARAAPRPRVALAPYVGHLPDTFAHALPGRPPAAVGAPRRRPPTRARAARMRGALGLALRGGRAGGASGRPAAHPLAARGSRRRTAGVGSRARIRASTTSPLAPTLAKLLPVVDLANHGRATARRTPRPARATPMVVALRRHRRRRAGRRGHEATTRTARRSRRSACCSSTASWPSATPTTSRAAGRRPIAAASGAAGEDRRVKAAADADDGAARLAARQAARSLVDVGESAELVFARDGAPSDATLALALRGCQRPRRARSSPTLAELLGRHARRRAWKAAAQVLAATSARRTTS